MTDIIGKEIERTLDLIISRANEELFGKTQEDLEDYWHFTWEEDRPILKNVYEFFKMLEHYRSFCRRWEEHQEEGACCVVERVRDKYLVPKMKQFIKDFTAAVEK